MASGSRNTPQSAHKPVHAAGVPKLRVGLLNWIGSTDLQLCYCADLLFYLTERAGAEDVDLEIMGAGPTPIGTTLPFPPLESVRRQRFDGIILNGIWEEPYIGELYKTGVPMVSLDFQPRGSPVDAVIFSGKQGGELAAKAMIQTRQRSVMVVTRFRKDLALPAGADPWVEDDTAIDRRMGLQSALVGSGIEVWSSVPYSANFRDKGEDEAANRLVRMLQSADTPPSIVFTTDADIAHTVVRVLKKLGHRVPEDVGIISFDAPTQIQQLGTFKYNAISYDWQEMGEAGWDLLMKRMKTPSGRSDKIQVIELSGTYTDRGSMPDRR
jgi:DNA-binding LacI/PurR family transcriptional regulator